MTKRIELYEDNIGFVECVSHMGSDVTIVNSARVSFGEHITDLGKRDKKLIKYLIKHRHTSTLEHNVVTFRFKVPLFIRSQHHRHRTWSFNEISRRYTSYNLEFYEPKQFRKQSESNRQASVDELIDPLVPPTITLKPQQVPVLASHKVCQHHKDSLKLFNELIEAGVCREQARGVLPQNLYTEYYGTCNLNNLFKFIDLRTHSGAQWEIQQVANAVLDIITELYPVTVDSYLAIRGE
jgi:thymidylate synthase (FAD)